MFNNINYGELIIVVERAFISLISLFLITKIIGKKQVSEMSLFDYVIGISIGNFAAEITINLEADIIYGVVGVLIFGIVAYFVSILTMKSIRLRRFFMSTPTILISNGKIVYSGLKKIKFDINDLLETCRIAGYFDVSEIECALMEANGSVSFLPKSDYKPLTCKDMNLKVKQQELIANVIIDEKIMKNNLAEMKKTPEWLIKQLNNKKVEEIILCTMDQDGNIKLFKKEEIKVLDILE